MEQFRCQWFAYSSPLEKLYGCLGFFGRAVFPRFLENSVGSYHSGPCPLHTERL